LTFHVRDKVSCLNSIGDVMRQALDAMLPNAEERAQLSSPIDNGKGESDDSEIVPQNRNRVALVWLTGAAASLLNHNHWPLLKSPHLS
jgi:hypothetical protein